MDRYLEKTGKTIEEAVSLALDEFEVDEDDVEIEILDEGSKGILGIGSKLAKVRVTLKDDKLLNAEFFLKDVLEKMNINASFTIEEDDEKILINIEGMDSGIIIGRRGETLDALQYLVSLVVNKDFNEYKRVVIDVENYRKKREESLVRLANKVSEKVRNAKKSVTLEPMNPYERRIIHSALQGKSNIKTYSIGDEPNRKVVVSIK